MPVWLQMAAALSAAVSAGVMGMALVPFLTKLRMGDREKQETQDPDAPAKELLRPTMGGLLIAFGLLMGLVPGVALYQQFSGADRTGETYHAQTELLRTVLLHSVLFTAAGFLTDHSRVKGRLLFGMDPRLRLGAVLLVTAALLAWQQGFIWQILPAAAAVTASFVLIQFPERDKTEGISLPLSAVQLLMLTVLLLRAQETLPAVFTLAGAGACLGSMIWCLHPAKCRIGCTGSYLLGSMAPMLCAAQGWYRPLALLMAVYAVNALPLLTRKHQTLLTRMQDSGMTPDRRMALLTGFAVLCGIMAVFAG